MVLKKVKKSMRDFSIRKSCKIYFFQDNISFSPFTVCNFITRIKFTTFDTFTAVEPEM